MAQFSRLSVLLLVMTGLCATGGCAVFPRPMPDIYSTSYAIDRGRSPDHPLVHQGESTLATDNERSATGKVDVAKTSFVLVLNTCSGSSAPEVTAPEATLWGKGSQWTPNNKASADCISKVVAYAVDQCVVAAGQQNRFAAISNYILGGALVAGALTADAAALQHSADESKTTAALLATAITGNIGNIQKIIPSIGVVPVDGMVKAAQSYTLVGGFSDQRDWPASCDAQCRSLRSLHYSRLHDVVLSACNSGAY